MRVAQETVRLCARRAAYWALAALCLLAALYVMLSKANTRHKESEAHANVAAEHDWFVVALLRDNAEIAGNWIDETLRTVDALTRAGAGVYVSVLENGDSKDSTGHMLRERLAPALAARSVPHTIVTEHVHKRPQGAGRIEWLSLLRNAALSPLLDGRVFGTAPGASGRPVRVLYLNDVWFDAEDALALAATAHGEYAVACAMDFYFGFYDAWVARDLDGRPLDGMHPHFRGRADAAAFASGAPVPVRSCWNGAVAMDAEPFLHGVRFRDHAGESECTVVCWDFAEYYRDRRGNHAIVINPKVVLTYHWPFRVLHTHVLPLVHPLMRLYHSLFRAIP